MIETPELLRDVMRAARENGCKIEIVNAVDFRLPASVTLVRLNGKLYNVLDARKAFRFKKGGPCYVRFRLSSQVLWNVEGTICRDAVDPDNHRFFVFGSVLRDTFFPTNCETQRKLLAIRRNCQRGGKANVDVWKYKDAWPRQYQQTPRR